MDLETNGHAQLIGDTRLTRIERRLTEITHTSEQRVAVLRDALADFTAAELSERDQEIARLKEQVTELQQKLEAKTAIDHEVAEIAQRLDA